jgi:VIT1/CCC1 family predicted Fe2+/Mn2+ transporter
MQQQPKRQRFAQKHLDPASRLGETLFGVIMVLSVTLTVGLNVSEGKEGVRELLYAAVGCNIAWGIIDGIMYVMTRLTERSGRAHLINSIREAGSHDAALEVIRGAVEPVFGEVADKEELEALYRSIHRNVSGREHEWASIEKEDLFGALASFWLVVLACFPAVVPFLIMSDPMVALRVSNLLLLATLFVIGVMWGDHAHTNRIVSGLAMLAIGLALVGIAIALGG